MIDSIELHNFKSFVAEELYFESLQNGLYFVSGDNQVDKELGANGAGKSALFEALCWCLYGKTSTNLKAGNVINWGAKSCWVEVGIDTHKIMREQSPNGLFINNQPVTQEELEMHLGYLGFESFLYSTFISQFSSKFFDLSPADKMTVFSDIMAETLHPWSVKSDNAKVRANECQVTINSLEMNVANLQGQLEQLNSVSYELESKRFEKDKKEKVKELTVAKLEKVAELKNTEKHIKELLKEKVKYEFVLKGLESNDYSGEISGLQSQLNEKAKELRELVAEEKSFQRSIKEIQGINKESICPTCLQKVDSKLLKKELSKIEKAIDEVSNDIHKVDLEHEKIFNEINQLKENQQAESQQRGQMMTELRVLQTTMDGVKLNIKRWEKEIEKLTNDLVKEENKENPYVEMEKQRKNKVGIVQQGIDVDTANINGLKRDFDAYTYWVKGFKEIRLLLMYDALKELEVSINNNLSKFGMEGWNVKLDIDKENKSGTIKKGFSVLVESPDFSGFVPFETWSGGEGQRLRLAGTIGLMDLIQSKRQISFGIEVFDEPSQHMSEQGIADLVTMLYERAKDQDKLIFLVDHRGMENYGAFAGEIKIVKDDKGSHIFL